MPFYDGAQVPCKPDDIQYNLSMLERYNPHIHHRRYIRIPGYDYIQDGWYFLTICTQNRNCIFGQILKGRMHLNNGGLMVKTWWQKVTNKFPSVQTDEYVIMPNHFHGIINIVGATPRGRPILCEKPALHGHPIAVNTNNKSGQSHNELELGQPHNELGQPHRVAPTVGDIVNWFKTMTTNQYIHSETKWLASISWQIMAAQLLRAYHPQ